MSIWERLCFRVVETKTNGRSVVYFIEHRRWLAELVSFRDFWIDFFQGKI